MKNNLLAQSLCMLKGISPATECTLRQRGIILQKQLLTSADDLFSAKQAAKIKNSYQRIEKIQQLNLLDGLVNALPCGHRVRVIYEYYQKTAFLDIETDGKSEYANITCISILKENKISTFVQGRNLDDFLDLWATCGIIVTFNGKRFDLPRILNEFCLTTVPAHIDLMHEAAHYGLRGGLKNITNNLGFQRKEQNCTIGNDAIVLWQEFNETQNEEKLSQLIAYNQDDVYALKWLYQKLLPRSLENTLIEIVPQA